MRVRIYEWFRFLILTFLQKIEVLKSVGIPNENHTKNRGIKKCIKSKWKLYKNRGIKKCRNSKWKSPFCINFKWKSDSVSKCGFQIDFCKNFWTAASYILVLTTVLFKLTAQILIIEPNYLALLFNLVIIIKGIDCFISF